MLTFEKQLDTFSSTLAFQRRGRKTNPAYTNMELIRLADDFLKTVTWVNPPTPEELVTGMRKRWGEKTKRANAQKRLLKIKTAELERQGTLF